MDPSARFYRRLLLLFPPSFRHEYGDEMTRLYLDRLREVEGRPGGARRLRWDAFRDATLHAPLEWGRAALATVRTVLREGKNVEGWIQDLRFGVRSLSRRPGFTGAAVATLALGLGATVAIFSVVNGVLLEPLPYPDPDRIVVLWQVDRETGRRSTGIDHPDVRVWQAEVPGITVAGYSGSRPTLTGLGEPEVVYGARVTDGLLAVFGLEPRMGRDLEAADDVPGGPRVMMISHEFWTTRLGGDPAVLGRTLTLNGNLWEVVGVAPEGFDFPNGAMYWAPRQHEVDGCGHGCRIMSGIGRIAPGATLEQVQVRMDAVSAQLSEAFPDSHRDLDTAFEPLLDTQVAGVRTALWVLMGSVVMVLLIACANVANLLLVRAAERVDEVALRATLGAPRIRILRQLLTESLLLAAVGGALGVGLAAWGVSAMVALAPDGIPRLDQAALDARALGFALAMVATVTAVFGLAPALKLARTAIAPVLGGGRRSGGRRGAGLARSMLLSGEVALSLLLLLGAGLLFETLRSIRAQDLGFQTERVERFRISLPDSRYDTEAGLRFFDELESRLTALPEVDAAGSAFGVPLASGRIFTSAEFLDREPVDAADQPTMAVRPASAGYRDALGLPLIRGRWFTAADRRDDVGVVVINQAAVDRFYPDRDPLGRRLRLSISWGFPDDPDRTVVGVVGNTRTSSPTEPDEPTAYLPNAQFGANVVYVTMRLARGAGSALPAARSVLTDMDPALAITNTQRIEEAVDQEMAPTRFYLTLLGAFSILALVLAAVGLYGVVAYSVSRRTREIGIRMALGARSGSVVGMALKEGVRPAVLGVALGIAASFAGARVLASLLYGVRPQDASTLATVVVVLMGVTAVATLVPALRASRVPPATALRVD